jgi:hypothetical protein
VSPGWEKLTFAQQIARECRWRTFVSKTAWPDLPTAEVSVSTVSLQGMNDTYVWFPSRW